jgi:NADH-quinone oxidoreductase subunit I
VVINAVRSILVGMMITFREFFNRPVTVQYPEARPFTGRRWRGVHGLFFTDALDEELCVSCHLCARICPAVCIKMDGHVEPDGTKRLHTFDVDLGRCIYCGYCEEVCPVDAIRLTTSTDYTVRLRDDFVLHKDDLVTVGRSAMKRGEHSALGMRTGATSSDEDRHYARNRNRDAGITAPPGTAHSEPVEERARAESPLMAQTPHDARSGAEGAA